MLKSPSDAGDISSQQWWREAAMLVELVAVCSCLQKTVAHRLLKFLS